MKSNREFRPVRWWAASLAIPVVLVAFHMAFTHSLLYGFYYWNLFLAVIPLVASTWLDSGKSLWSWRNLVSLGVWFAFLPNAPYLVTDMVHFHQEPRVPIYLDEAIVCTTAWNGVLLGYASMRKIEVWLLERYAERPVRIAVIAVFLACGFGIYLGRYVRLNSWDILVHPFMVGRVVSVRVLFPFEHRQTWAVTLLFGLLLWVGYRAFRSQALKRSIA
jgi:uncharacterized membrane protein